MSVTPEEIRTQNASLQASLPNELNIHPLVQTSNTQASVENNLGQYSEALRGAFIEAIITKELSLTSKNIKDEAVVRHIVPFLNVNPSITNLDVSYNHIEAAGAASLAANQTIKTLNINNNHIETAGAAALAENQTITNLSIWGNQIGDISAAALARNQTITTLNVDSNQIGAAGAAALARNQTITTLHAYITKLEMSVLLLWL